jgi:hypothetical protein
MGRVSLILEYGAMGKVKEDTRPLGAPHSWARTPGTYISGRANIDGADQAAVEMERKWGVDRLRLLVTPELREKFDRQRYLFNQAVWHGDLEAVRREASRMTAAWLALDKAATAAAASVLSPQVWEVTLTDGSVAAIVPDGAAAHGVMAQGRKVTVYTLDEIARLLSHYPQIALAKQTFPGATITAVRRPEDPLDAIADTLGGIDDPLDDPIPTFGA